MHGPDGRLLKVPQIGWNQLCHAETDPLLAGVPDGAYAYFVHSYYCAPVDPHTSWRPPISAVQYASVVRARQRLGHPVPPGEEPGGGAADPAELSWRAWRYGRGCKSGQFILVTRKGGTCFIIYPAIDLRHGQVRAPAPGRSGRADDLCATIRGGRAALGRSRAPSGCTWSIWTARSPVGGLNLSLGLDRNLNLRRLADIRAAVAPAHPVRRRPAHRRTTWRWRWSWARRASCWAPWPSASRRSWRKR